ncbi:MAG: PfkB family carbohydrate kinase [Nitrospinota bacterium]|nr:PfkB family carbohydrate kinase [Nitrospinota bacterium]
MDADLHGRAQAFGGRRVLVLGDLIADEYLLGTTHRVSREAPVLILRRRSREVRLGGAGNAANNVRALGGEVSVLGLLGDDDAGREVSDLLQERGIDASGVVRPPEIETTVKMRILAGRTNTTMQQVIRIDREGEGCVPREAADRLARALRERAEAADAILISDYGLGAVGPEVLRAVNDLAKDKRAANGGLPVLVDSRYGLRGFHGVTAVTPNEEEMHAVLGDPPNAAEDDDKLFREAEALRERMGIQGILLTRGKHGMVLFEAGRPPESLDIFGGDDVADVTGAGDTVTGTFCLSLAAEAGMREAARLANIAGGLVVMKRGTATVSQRELLEVL